MSAMDCHGEHRRIFVTLETGVKEEAARRAAELYRDILTKGWAEALAKYRPEPPKPEPEPEPVPVVVPPVTIGQVIAASRRLSSARGGSKETYERALRKIAADVFGIPEKGKLKGHGEAWRAKIAAIPLADLTPAKVLAWKNAKLEAAGLAERPSVAVTVNSTIRNAKALFSKRIRPFLEAEMELPRPLFFEGILPEKEPSPRYRSKVDGVALLRAAYSELSASNPEAFKMFLLVLVFGLRRSEADSLLWSQFDFQKGVLRIEDTEFHRLKSSDSAGEIDMEPETVALFRGFKRNAKGPFVLEGSPFARLELGEKRKSRSYRTEITHVALSRWLRAQGVTDKKPIHAMRKEIGSIIASRDGIFAASRYLRHSDIRITSRIYADKKTPVTAGLGAILGECAPNVIAASFGSEAVGTNLGKSQAGT
jgi:integrase